MKQSLNVLLSSVKTSVVLEFKAPHTVLKKDIFMCSNSILFHVKNYNVLPM